MESVTVESERYFEKLREEQDNLQLRRKLMELVGEMF